MHMKMKNYVTAGPTEANIAYGKILRTLRSTFQWIRCGFCGSFVGGFGWLRVFLGFLVVGGLTFYLLRCSATCNWNVVAA